MRQLKSVLDKMSLDDIALFKQFSVKNPGGDIEELIRSLRLFLSTKEVFEKQRSTQAKEPVQDESANILTEAMIQYHDDMSQEEKEKLARATIRKLSNQQLKSLTPGKIAEGIVRVDKQLTGMGEEMNAGVNDVIRGTGWEKVAGGVRVVKGAASVWGFMAFAAVIAAQFVPVLNVAVLLTHAFVAGMVAYAAANLQMEAEIQAASRAKSPEDFQKHSIVGAAVRTDVVISSVVMALPVAGKLIGKIPLPADLKNVATVLKTARNTLKQTSGKAFRSARESVLEALSKTKTDLQPYIIQFRVSIGSIVRRLRAAKGSDFLQEVKTIPELQELVSPETAKALEGLSPGELAVYQKGIIEALDNAPAVAEETLKSHQANMTVLEKKVQAANSAQDLESVLSELTKTTEPDRMFTEAGTQAVENVVQARTAKISNISTAEVKKSLTNFRREVQNLPNTNPNKQSVLNELKNLLRETEELEKKQGKTDISKELEDISRRDEELDDLVADAIAKMIESRRPHIAPTQKVAPPSPGSRKQPPQLMQGQEYNIAHAFDYKYRELYIRDPKGGPSFKLDGYEPGKWIVSRKNQQLSEISLSEAKSHIAEFADKYAKGRLIDSSVPSSGLQTGGAPATGGQKLSGTLQGQYVLEVPVQSKPVPVDILVAAKNADIIIIRDVSGKNYSLPSPTLP